MKIIRIERCKDCPHHYEERDYTGDAFETEFKWGCKLRPDHFPKGDPWVRRHVDWNDKQNDFISADCSLETLECQASKKS